VVGDAVAMDINHPEKKKAGMFQNDEKWHLDRNRDVNFQDFSSNFREWLALFRFFTVLKFQRSAFYG